MKLFSTTGRVNREPYLWFLIFCLFVVLANPYVVHVLYDHFGAIGVLLDGLAMWAFLILATWCGIAMTIKRLQDIGRPGWHCVLLLIPFYGFYLGLVLLIEPGTVGSNQFGDDPLIPGDSNENDRALNTAYRHEMNGDWDHAFDLYTATTKSLAGESGGEYAMNCLQRLQGKIALSRSRETRVPAR